MNRRRRAGTWQRQISLLVLIGLIVASLSTAYATPPISGQTIEFEATAQEVGGHTDDAYSVAAGDLDGDGDLDLVSGGKDMKVIAWQNDGTPFSGGWTSQEVGFHPFTVLSVAVGDLDGDGDLDIVSGASDNKINVWQNDGTPFTDAWTAQEVGSHPGDVSSVAVGDLDGDGDLDLISGGTGTKVNVWENDGTPFTGTWTAQEVGSHTSYVRAVAVGDLDGDGSLDVVSGAGDNKVNVWQNDGTPFDNAWSSQEAGSLTEAINSLAVGDLDGDGDLDLASSGNDQKVNVWRNDGTPFTGAWTKQYVGSHTGSALPVAVGDLDGDGDLDIVSGGVDSNVNAWHNDGTPFSGSWNRKLVGSHTDWVYSVAVGDLDGDGDLDIASGGFDDKVNVWQNAQVHRNMPFGSTATDVGSHGGDVFQVVAGDLDRDGDLDLASASFHDDKVNVWQNDGTPFDDAWTKQEVGSHTSYVRSVAAGDLDGDGDLDLVSGGDDYKVNVWQNDGTPFDGGWTMQGVGGHTDNVLSVAVADLDGDGDLDIVSGGTDYKVNAWQNDGTPFSGSWAKQEVGSHTLWLLAVTVGDLDGDGDLDVVTAGSDDKVNAWQNDGTPFTGTWTGQEVGSHTSDAWPVAVGDLDGDGDLDIVSGGVDYKVNAWQNDGTPFDAAWTGQEVGGHTNQVTSVAVGDLDGDGDLDLLSCGYDDKVNVWHNDGTPFAAAWTRQEVGSHTGDSRSVAPGDLDGDGDLDLVSGGNDNKAKAWQNQGGSAGLAVSDTAPDTINNSTEDDVLKVVFSHNGIAGDRDLELARLDLDLFRSDCSTPLIDSEANAVIANLRVRLDDGDDVFETDGSDVLLTDVDTVWLIGGVQMVAFANGEANVQVSAGNNKTYWISLLTTGDASDQSPAAFCVNLDPDEDALVEGKGGGPSDPDFSASQQDTAATNTGAINKEFEKFRVYLPILTR